jgi:MFS family permease
VLTHKLRALLSIRWVGQLTDGLFQSALASFVLFSPERAPSAVDAAVAFAVVLLPYSIVGPYVGIFLDRFSRQRIVTLANIFRALDLIVIAVLIKAGATGILLTFFVLLAFGANRLILAGLSAGLPLLSTRESLVATNALAVTGGTIGVVIGGGVGIGIKNILDRAHNSDFSSFIVVVTASACYLLAALLAQQLSTKDIGPHEHEVTSEIRGFAEMFEGFSILRSHGDSLRGIIATAIQRGGVTALTLMGLLLERNTFHSPDNPDAGLKGFGYALAIAGVGVGLGSLISPWAVARLGRHKWIRISLLGPIPILILFGIHHGLVLFILSAFFVGLFGQAVKVTNDALIQSKIQDEYRGRAFAFYDVAVNAGIMGGALIAAAILPKSGNSHALPIVIAGVFALGGAVLLKSSTFFADPTK